MQALITLFEVLRDRNRERKLQIKINVDRDERSDLLRKAVYSVVPTLLSLYPTGFGMYMRKCEYLPTGKMGLLIYCSGTCQKQKIKDGWLEIGDYRVPSRTFEVLIQKG